VRGHQWRRPVIQTPVEFLPLLVAGTGMWLKALTAGWSLTGNEDDPGAWAPWETGSGNVATALQGSGVPLIAPIVVPATVPPDVATVSLLVAALVPESTTLSSFAHVPVTVMLAAVASALAGAWLYGWMRPRLPH